jgi:hypothetical protein
MSMRIDGVIPGLTGAGEPIRAAALAVRLLAGNLPDLPSGQPVPATVVGTQGAATLLEVKGQQLLVEGLPRLPAGTEVAVTLQGGTSNPVLEVGPSLHPALASLSLSVGQDVVARVVQQLPGGHVVINVQGVPLEAAAPPGLAPGTEIALRVAQLQPQLVFHIVEDSPSVESQAAQVIRVNLPDRAPVAESLVALRQAIAALTAPENIEPPPASITRLQTALDRLLPEQSPSAETVAAFVRDGGLHLEAKLARAADGEPAAAGRAIAGDVKGLVLKALDDMQGAGPSPQAQGLTAALARHLGGIETQQALNLLAQLHGEAFSLQIPFYAGQQPATAFLSVEADGSPGGQQGGRGSGHNVLFLLDLDGLGRTRIDARFSGSAIRVMFYVEGDATLNRVRSELPAFGRALQGLGYDDVLLAARPLGEMPADRRQKAEALALGVPAGVHLIDVRA